MDVFKPVSKNNKILVQGYLSGIRLQTDYQFTGLELNHEELRALSHKQKEMIETSYDLIPNKLKIRKIKEEDIERLRAQ
jgi:hypothetical protein